MSNITKMVIISTRAQGQHSCTVVRTVSSQRESSGLDSQAWNLPGWSLPVGSLQVLRPAPTVQKHGLLASKTAQKCECECLCVVHLYVYVRPVTEW